MTEKYNKRTLIISCIITGCEEHSYDACERFQHRKMSLKVRGTKILKDILNHTILNQNYKNCWFNEIRSKRFSDKKSNEGASHHVQEQNYNVWFS